MTANSAKVKSKTHIKKFEEEETETSVDQSSFSNETGLSNDTSTSNETTTVNGTKKEEIDEASVASVYPYWRANREPKQKNKTELENPPYEPRPAKYKENYEDKGIKVFKPDFEVVGTVTTDTFAKLADPNPRKKSKGS